MKNTIKDLIQMMEEYGENEHYIIGWLSSMIDGAVNETDKHWTMQQSIDNGMKYYRDKALVKAKMDRIQKTANEASLEELYA